MWENARILRFSCSNPSSGGNPTCRFTLEVDEIAKGGEVFILYLPVELWGQAETAAETLEPGDEVMMTGKLKYKSVVDAKTQAKVSKLIVSSWGISQRLPGKTSGPAEGDSISPGEIVAPGPTGEVAPTKKRVGYAET